MTAPQLLSQKTLLPVVSRPFQPWKSWGLHGVRIAVFFSIVLVIHLESRARHQVASSQELPIEVRAQVRKLIPDAEVGPQRPETGLYSIVNRSGELVNYLAMTSPTADHIIGFSGPTNVLLVFDLELKLVAAEVAWSRDTPEHAAAVVQSSTFWRQFLARNWQDLAENQKVDAVSGATLTSLAVGESIIARLGGKIPSLRFPDPITLLEAQQLFSNAFEIMPLEGGSAGWDIRDAEGSSVGKILSTSPAADTVTGYQGPTETLIVISHTGTIARTHVRQSFDNEPYVSYLNDDWSWPELFKGLTLRQLAEFDLEAQGVEGVSGATFTSMAVAQGLIQTAQIATKPIPPTPPISLQQWTLTEKDYGTLAVIVTGVIIALTHLRGVRWLRIVYQLVLIGYVGFLNGDLLSQGMFVGWAQNGIPWRSASRLVVLAGLAFLFPVVTKKNVYCSHLCAHGAAQQLLRSRLRLQWHPSRNVRRFLSMIPLGLLVWVIVVAVQGWAFSLVNIEAFDAYLFRIAGWSAVTIAITGLFASLFLPMAYCRYGCPTGALLEYFRRTRKSDRLSPADGMAMGLLILAVVLFWIP